MVKFVVSRCLPTLAMNPALTNSFKSSIVVTMRFPFSYLWSLFVVVVVVVAVVAVKCATVRDNNFINILLCFLFFRNHRQIDSGCEENGKTGWSLDVNLLLLSNENPQTSTRSGMSTGRRRKERNLVSGQQTPIRDLDDDRLVGWVFFFVYFSTASNAINITSLRLSSFLFLFAA